MDSESHSGTVRIGAIGREPAASVDDRRVSTTNRPIGTRVQVQDSRGIGVPGASIRQASSTEVEIRTDPSGSASVCLVAEDPSTTFATLDVEAEGHAPARSVVPVDAREWTIRLSRSVGIAGRVTLPEGEPSGVELRVLAWPYEWTRVPPRDEYARFVGHGPLPGPRDRLRVALCEADGTFWLDGIDPSTHHYLIAGGPGYLTDILEVGSPGTQEVALTAKHVYGAVIDFIDESGLPLVLSPSLRSSWKRAYWTQAPDAEPILLTDLGAALSGFALDEPGPPESRKVCLFTSPRRAAELGPCEVEVRVPGFRTASLTFSASGLELGPTRVRMVLENLHPERGSITLVPSGASPEVLAAHRDARRFVPQMSAALLTLEDAGGGGRMQFGFDLRLDVPTVVHDVPPGIYTCHVDTMHQQAPLPPSDQPGLPLEVIAGRNTSLPLDFSGFGALIVELDESGSTRPFDGWARWILAHGEPLRRPNGTFLLDPADPQVFVRGPYLVGIVPAGTITLRGDVPGWGPPADGEGLLTVQIDPGHVRTVRVATRR